MSGTRTPPRNILREQDIPEWRLKRKRTKFEGCTQLYQYFIKADGTLSCSCMKYWDILGDTRTMDAGSFFNGPMMQYIRESFAEGYEPFSFCADCPSRLSKFETKAKTYDYIDLHIEPSNRCNLYCEVCICTFERLTENPPARLDLDYDLYEKMLREIHGAGLSLRTLALVGFGEPLFNSRIPDMAALARRLYPDANIFLDTNANFGKKRAEEIADCGLNVIRLALDGVDQQSYAPYRRNGDFDRALQFTRDLAKAIRETGSKTRAVWKYILFKHNDTDADILKAVALSKEIGISIIFDATVGAWASPRTSDELHALVGQHFGCNIDPTSTDGAQMELGQPKEGTALSRLFRRLRGGSDAKSPAQ